MNAGMTQINDHEDTNAALQLQMYTHEDHAAALTKDEHRTPFGTIDDSSHPPETANGQHNNQTDMNVSNGMIDED